MLTFGKLNISNMIVEVCANSLQSSLNAENAGAHRIELCSELGIGGITPSFGLLKKVKEKLSLPVHVLIRPRSGDFTYSDLEFNIMKEDILFCREMGFAGIVSGVLHSDFSLDLSRTGTLVELAGDLTFTFHRAFDWVKDPITTLAQLENIGVACLLTSGQQRSAVEGMRLLKQLHLNALKCQVMPGGGINETNIREFRENGFKAIHLSGAQFHQTLAELPEIAMNSPSHLRENFIGVSDPEVIKKIVKMVK
jgi:copper homeostasis protein